MESFRDLNCLELIQEVNLDLEEVSPAPRRRKIGKQDTSSITHTPNSSVPVSVN